MTEVTGHCGRSQAQDLWKGDELHPISDGMEYGWQCVDAAADISRSSRWQVILLSSLYCCQIATTWLHSVHTHLDWVSLQLHVWSAHHVRRKQHNDPVTNELNDLFHSDGKRPGGPHSFPGTEVKSLCWDVTVACRWAKSHEAGAVTQLVDSCNEEQYRLWNGCCLN